MAVKDSGFTLAKIEDFETKSESGVVVCDDKGSLYVSLLCKQTNEPKAYSLTEIDLDKETLEDREFLSKLKEDVDFDQFSKIGVFSIVVQIFSDEGLLCWTHGISQQFSLLYYGTRRDEKCPISMAITESDFSFPASSLEIEDEQLSFLKAFKIDTCIVCPNYVNEFKSGVIFGLKNEQDLDEDQLLCLEELSKKLSHYLYINRDQCTIINREPVIKSINYNTSFS